MNCHMVGSIWTSPIRRTCPVQARSWQPMSISTMCIGMLMLTLWDHCTDLYAQGWQCRIFSIGLRPIIIFVYFYEGVRARVVLSAGLSGRRIAQRIAPNRLFLYYLAPLGMPSRIVIGPHWACSYFFSFKYVYTRATTRSAVYFRIGMCRCISTLSIRKFGMAFGVHNDKEKPYGMSWTNRTFVVCLCIVISSLSVRLWWASPSHDVIGLALIDSYM